VDSKLDLYIEQVNNEHLKEADPNPLYVESLADYVSAIEAISLLYPAERYYRGQPDYDMEITSSAFRQLAQSSLTSEKMHDYHLQLLSGARKLADVEKFSDMNLIAHMQHYGAKTFLIDYSKNPVVSLWMACISHPDYNGVVYFFKRDAIAPIEEKEDVKLDVLFAEPDSDKVYRFQPTSDNRRILNQQSVFLFTPNGKMNKEDHIHIIVPKAKKRQILTQLELINVDGMSLFPDFHGFIAWYQFNAYATNVSAFDKCLRSAKELRKRKKFAFAEKKYNGSDSIKSRCNWYV